ncbi:UNVERIFIED_CONTAM: hypothetical protein HHA_316610 [Hammondia hammondi]|eukprot:XP_008883307.1 hypothetical protein HHA_316610 [Hammondia hammondi]
MGLPAVSSPHLSRGPCRVRGLGTSSRHSSSLSSYHRDRRKPTQPSFPSSRDFATSAGSPTSSSPSSSSSSSSSPSSSSPLFSLFYRNSFRAEPFKRRSCRSASCEVSPSRLLLLRHLLRRPPLVLPGAACSRAPSLRPNREGSPHSPVAAATSYALSLAASLHPEASGGEESLRSSEDAAGFSLLDRVTTKRPVSSSASCDTLRVFLDGSWQSLLPGDAISRLSPASPSATPSTRLWLLSLLAPPSCDSRLARLLEVWLAHALGKKDVAAQSLCSGSLRSSQDASDEGETLFNSLHQEEGDRQQHVPLVLLAASLYNLHRLDLLRRLMTEERFLSSAASVLPARLLPFFARLYVHTSSDATQLVLCGSSTWATSFREKLQHHMSRKKEYEGYFNALAATLALSASSPSQPRFSPDSLAVSLQALALFHYAPLGFSSARSSPSPSTAVSGSPRQTLVRDTATSDAESVIGLLRHPLYAQQMHVFDASELNELFISSFCRLLLQDAGDAKPVQSGAPGTTREERCPPATAAVEGRGTCDSRGETEGCETRAFVFERGTEKEEGNELERETTAKEGKEREGEEENVLSLEGLVRLTDVLLLRDGFMREQFAVLREKHLASLAPASAGEGGNTKRRGDPCDGDQVLDDMHSFWSVYIEHQEAVLESLCRRFLRVEADAWKGLSPRTLLNLLHALLRLHQISPDALGASVRRTRGHAILSSLCPPPASPSALASAVECHPACGREEEGQGRAEGEAACLERSEGQEALGRFERCEAPREQETSDPKRWRNALWADMLRAAIDTVGGPGASGPIAAYAAATASLAPGFSLFSSSPAASAAVRAKKSDPSGPSPPPVFLLFAQLLEEIRQRPELGAVEAALLLDAVACLSSHPFTRSAFVDTRGFPLQCASSFQSSSSQSSSSQSSSPQSSSPQSSSPQSSSACVPVARRSESVERLAESFFSLREVGAEVVVSPLPRHREQEEEVERVLRSLSLKALRLRPSSLPVGHNCRQEGEVVARDAEGNRTEQKASSEKAIAAPHVQEITAPASSPQCALSSSLSSSVSSSCSSSQSSSVSWRFPAVDDALVCDVIQRAVFRDVPGLTLPAALLLLQGLRDLHAFDQFPLFELLLANVLREAHSVEPQQILFIAATLHGLRHSLVRSLSSSLSSPSSPSSSPSSPPPSSSSDASSDASSHSRSVASSRSRRDSAPHAAAEEEVEERGFNGAVDAHQRQQNRALFAAVKERRRQRRRLKTVRQMEQQVLQLVVDRQTEFLHAPREFAALFYVFSKTRLLTPAYVLKLQSACLSQLPRLSPRDLTLFSLGVSIAVSAPGAAAFPREILSALFSALANSLAAFSPRELAVACWCMHALGCAGPGAPPGELRRLVDSCMQKLHSQMRLFSPKELLLISLTLARADLQRQTILLDLYRAMYAFLPLYDPDELAVAVFAFGRARIVDSAIELRFLHHVALAIPFFSPQALAQVVLGFYSLQRSPPSSSPSLPPSPSPSPPPSPSSSSPSASAPSSSLSASLVEKRNEIRSQLLPRVLAEAPTLPARHLAGIFLCAAALTPKEDDLRQLMNAMLLRVPAEPPAQRAEQQTKGARKCEEKREEKREEEEEGGRGWEVREVEGQRQHVSAVSARSRSPPVKHSEERRERDAKVEEKISKVCMLSAVELVRVLQTTADLSFFPRAFVKCLLFALRKKAGNLDSLQLLSALYALDQLGYAPPRLRWRLGSLVKEKSANYRINMSDLLAAAPVLDRLGIFKRLDVKLQHEIYDRLDEETRRQVTEPLPPNDPSEASTLHVAPRARNLALLPARVEGKRPSKVCLLFPRKRAGTRQLPSQFLELPPGPDPRDAEREEAVASEKKRRTAPPSPEEEALQREEEPTDWGSREEKHAAEIFREAIRRL